MSTVQRDGDKLVAWLREAADELEKAHAILDAYGVPRDLGRGDGIECSLAARIALIFDGDRDRRGAEEPWQEIQRTPGGPSARAHGCTCPSALAINATCPLH